MANMDDWIGTQLVPTLVLVDDDQLMHERVRRLFRKTEIKPQCYLDSEEALVDLQINSPRAMVVDYRMPKLSGLELIAKLDHPASELMFLWSAAPLPDEVAQAARQLGVVPILKDQTAKLLEDVSNLR